MRRFTVCVLLYGGDEHAWLHSRCLESLDALPSAEAEIRIGLNAVTAASTLIQLDKLHERIGDGLLLFAGDNIGKYPRMREMFNTISRPLLIWFDDDSYLLPTLRQPGAGQAWLDKIAQMQAQQPCIMGATYHQHWSGRHRRWVMAHPKYKGVPLHPTHEQFITGGWWTAPIGTLRKLEWPPTELYHNGGDRMLGWMARQNHVPLVRFTDGVAINADASGIESSAARRGLNTKGPGD